MVSPSAGVVEGEDVALLLQNNTCNRVSCSLVFALVACLSMPREVRCGEDPSVTSFVFPPW
jgi:hypothetical protein